MLIGRDYLVIAGREGVGEISAKANVILDVIHFLCDQVQDWYVDHGSIVQSMVLSRVQLL